MAGPPDETPDTIAEAGRLPVAEAAEALHGHEVAAGASEVAAHGGEGGGLPQFEFQYWGGQIVWLLLTFAVLYVLLARVFVPRLRRALDVRAQTIAGAVAAARQVQAEAESQAEAARNELAEARANSQRTATEAKARAKAEADARQIQEEARLGQYLAQAEDRVRTTRDQAMSNVGAIAADTAQAIMEKLTGRSAAPAEMQSALSQASREGAR